MRLLLYIVILAFASFSLGIVLSVREMVSSGRIEYLNGFDARIHHNNGQVTLVRCRNGLPIKECVFSEMELVLQ